jgi:drug/metabolite transporter (DMT)-like permease
VTRRNVLAVVLWMIGALFAFSTIAVSVRSLSRTLALFDILALRNVIGLILLVGWAAVRPPLRAEIKTRRLPLHLVRNVVHFGGTYAWTVGLTLLPLATVFALEFTTPAWVALLAALLLRERFTTGRVISIACGFIGVLVILRPGIAALTPASFVVLVCALLFALTSIATKALTTTDSTFTILFWMNAIQLPLNLVGSSPGLWLTLDASHVVPVVGVGLGGLCSHLCLTNAFRHGDAMMVIPLDFLRIPLIALIGWRFYGEALDPIVFAGAAIIIAGIIWNLRDEATRAVAATTPSGSQP